jgi:hypothetical protein
MEKKGKKETGKDKEEVGAARRNAVSRRTGWGWFTCGDLGSLSSNSVPIIIRKSLNNP